MKDLIINCFVNVAPHTIWSVWLSTPVCRFPYAVNPSSKSTSRSASIHGKSSHFPLVFVIIMDLRQLQQMMGNFAQQQQQNAAVDLPVNDTSEKIQISSLALLKMLKHGRQGIPMEVMGLMLGHFIDDYTISCVDVFAMPQVRQPQQLNLNRVEVSYFSFSNGHSLTITSIFPISLTAWIGCQRGSCWWSLSSGYAGQLETNRTSWDGGWMVPLSPRIWCVDVKCWCQHSEELWAA